MRRILDAPDSLASLALLVARRPGRGGRPPSGAGGVPPRMRTVLVPPGVQVEEVLQVTIDDTRAADRRCASLLHLLEAQLAVPMQDADALMAHVACAATAIGFEHCAYGLRLALPFTRRKFAMVSSYAASWRARYLEAGYLCVDPTVRHGLRSTTPLLWSDALFGSAPQLWAEARSYGLRVGWSQSCVDMRGRVGMLSVARSSEALGAAERQLREPLLYWLTQLAHRALAPMLAVEEEVRLTPREREVLQWTADGKTSETIAQILRISVNTVNFHLKNSIEKLGASNKTSAASRATALGLLG